LSYNVVVISAPLTGMTNFRL